MSRYRGDNAHKYWPSEPGRARTVGQDQVRPLYTGAAGQCLAHQDSRCHHSLGAVPAQPADGGVRPSEYLLARRQREW